MDWTSWIFRVRPTTLILKSGPFIFYFFLAPFRLFLATALLSFRPIRYLRTRSMILSIRSSLDSRCRHLTVIANDFVKSEGLRDGIRHRRLLFPTPPTPPFQSVSSPIGEEDCSWRSLFFLDTKLFSKGNLLRSLFYFSFSFLSIFCSLLSIV